MASEVEQARDTEPKTRVFISYSRKDMAFVDHLDVALKMRGIEPLIDRTEIYAFEDWWNRLQALISRSDTVVFVLSPDAVTSSVTLKEVEYATSLNRRFAPIVYRRVEDDATPEVLRRLNFVYFDDPLRFEASIDKLADGLLTDIGWIRKHTEFGEHARQWANQDRRGGLLLRSPVLEEAERWIASRPPGAPEPTAETQVFLVESRRAATRRRNILIGTLSAGLCLFAILTTISVGALYLATKQADDGLSAQSRFLAHQSELARSTDGTLGTLLALAALPSRIDNPDRPLVAVAIEALYGAFFNQRERRIFTHSAPVGNVVFSPDGTTVVAGAQDHSARMWDIKSGALIGVLEDKEGTSGGPDLLIPLATFSTDGSRMLTTGQRVVRLWDGRTAAPIATLWDEDASSVATQDETWGCQGAFSPDGKLLVTSGRNIAHIWDATTGKQVVALSGHKDSIFSAAFSPDGKRVLTVARDQTARIWDSVTGREIFSLRDEKEFFSAAAFSMDGNQIVTASGHNARLWDAATGNSLLVYEHNESIESATFSSDGGRILTTGDNIATLWNAKTGNRISRLDNKSRITWNSKFSPDSKLILTLTYADKKAHIWDAFSGSPIVELSGSTGFFDGATFSPDNKYLAIATDKTARLFDTKTWAQVAVLRGHGDSVYSVSFSPDSGSILSASADSSARLWSIESSALVKKLDVENEAAIDSAAFSPNGNVFAIGDGQKIRLVDSWTGLDVGAFLGHQNRVDSIKFSSDGSRILSTDGLSTRIWNVLARKQIMSFDRGSTARWSHAADLSRDGSRVITQQFVWDPNTGNLIRTLGNAARRVTLAAFSPDGSRALIGPEGGIGEVWDVASGVRIAQLPGHPSDVDGSFSPDGTRILTYSAKYAWIWDAQTGTKIAELDGHNSAIFYAEFSPDGHRVITASADATARIWRSDTGTILAVLRGHSGEIHAAALSLDGRRLVTGSMDGTARWWDTNSGTFVAELNGHADVIDVVALSSNGARILTASNDRTIRLWSAPRCQPLIDEASQIPRQLTSDERNEYFLGRASPRSRLENLFFDLRPLITWLFPKREASCDQ